MKLKVILIVFISVLFVQNARAQIVEYDEAELKELCSTEEGRQKILNSLEEHYVQDIRLSAYALGLDPDEQVRKKIDQICQQSPQPAPDTGSFQFDPNSSSGAIDEVVIPIAYTFTDVKCNVKWNEYCDNTWNLQVPPGWQACRLEYSVVSDRGNTKLEVNPAFWFEGDSLNPDRFRGYTIRLRADGNNEFLNRVGARIHLTNLRIIALPARHDNGDRYQASCEMPINPKNQKPLPTVKVDVPNDAPTSSDSPTSSEPSNKICSCLVYDGTDGEYTIYRGTNVGRVSIVCPGGSWTSQAISPGRKYRIGPGCGFNCSIPPR